MSLSAWSRSTHGQHSCPTTIPLPVTRNAKPKHIEWSLVVAMASFDSPSGATPLTGFRSFEQPTTDSLIQKVVGTIFLRMLLAKASALFGSAFRMAFHIGLGPSSLPLFRQ